MRLLKCCQLQYYQRVEPPSKSHTATDILSQTTYYNDGLERTETFDRNGYLRPGTYLMTAIAEEICWSNLVSADIFSSYDFDLTFTPRANNFCVGGVNSSGKPARLSTRNSVSIDDDAFRVQVNDSTPNALGILFYGASQIQTPFGDGFRCVGGTTFRVVGFVTDKAGFGDARVRFGSGPASGGLGLIQPESTWNFQVWYRDPTGPGGSGFNLSDGLAVRFTD